MERSHFLLLRHSTALFMKVLTERTQSTASHVIKSAITAFLSNSHQLVRNHSTRLAFHALQEPLQRWERGELRSSILLLIDQGHPLDKFICILPLRRMKLLLDCGGGGARPRCLQNIILLC